MKAQAKKLKIKKNENLENLDEKNIEKIKVKIEKAASEEKNENLKTLEEDEKNNIKTMEEKITVENTKDKVENIKIEKAASSDEKIENINEKNDDSDDESLAEEEEGSEENAEICAKILNLMGNEEEDVQEMAENIFEEKSIEEEEENEEEIQSPLARRGNGSKLNDCEQIGKQLFPSYHEKNESDNGPADGTTTQEANDEEKKQEN